MSPVGAVVAGWGCEIMSTSSWPSGEMPVFGQVICAGCGDRLRLFDNPLNSAVVTPLV
jgi:hypothetical protein